MTKLAFLSALRSKLGILNADEINDIIDEYSGYIDSKIAEGKSEEDAVNDFGSVDDLASEILDAYKINKEYAKEKQSDSRRNSDSARQTTIDDFMSALGDILNQTIEYATRFFRNVFQDYSVESLAQILVIFLVAIVIIAFMKIPFFVIENIGSGFIHFILPYGFARILALFWRILVNGIFFLISLLVIAGLIQGVMDKKDISQSVREMFKKTARSMKYSYRNDHEKQPGKTQSKNTESKETRKTSSTESKTTIIFPTDSSTSGEEANELMETDFSSNTNLRTSEPITLVLHDEPINTSRDSYEELRSENVDDISDDGAFEEESITNETTSEIKKPKKLVYEDTRPSPVSKTWVDMMLGLMLGLLKIFVLLVLIPFYGAMLGITIAIGAMIYLLFQGISIFGFIVLAIGVLSLIGTFTSFVWYLLDRRKSYRFQSYKASILTSCILLGFGGVFSFFDVMRFDYDHSPEVFATFSEKKNLYYDLTDSEQTFQFGTSQIMLVEDKQLTDGRIKIQLQYHNKDGYLDEYTEDKTTFIFMNQYGNRFGEFKFIIDTMIEGLRNNKIYNADYYSTYVVHVHANANTLTKLSLAYNKVNYLP